MRLINERVVDRFMRKHPDSRIWLVQWLVVARAAEWQTIHDVKRAYPTADGGVQVRSGATATVFDVCGNKYRMITVILYQTLTVTILEVMTHAEYSTNRWKRKY